MDEEGQELAQTLKVNQMGVPQVGEEDVEDQTLAPAKSSPMNQSLMTDLANKELQDDHSADEIPKHSLFAE